MHNTWNLYFSHHLFYAKKLAYPLSRYCLCGNMNIQVKVLQLLFICPPVVSTLNKPQTFIIPKGTASRLLPEQKREDAMRGLLGHSKQGVKGCTHSYSMFFYSYQTIQNKILFISTESSITTPAPDHRLNVKHLLGSLVAYVNLIQSKFQTNLPLQLGLVNDCLITKKAERTALL